MKGIGWNRWLEFFGVAAFLFVIGTGAYSYANLGVFNNIENAIQVFDGLGWFVGSFALATLFTAYLVVIADTKFIFRFLAIPAWLAFAFTLLVALDQFLGYTYPAVPPQAQLLSYRVIRDVDTNQRIIEAWMYLPDEHRTRAYRFDFEQNKEEALYRAMRAKARGEQGVEVDLDPFKGKRKKIHDTPQPEDMIKYDIRHRDMPMKDYGDGKIVEGDGDTAPNDMGQSRRSDPIIVQMPGGGQFELEPGASFTITPEGEIEILDPGSVRQKQIKQPSSSSGNSGPHPSGNDPTGAGCPPNCPGVSGSLDQSSGASD